MVLLSIASRVVHGFACSRQKSIYAPTMSHPVCRHFLYTVGPVVIPDDVFHCRNLSSLRNNSISCDPETLEWNLTQLSEARPPGICPRNFTIPPEEVQNVQDWFEPCALWAMIYGNLKFSANSTEFDATGTQHSLFLMFWLIQSSMQATLTCLSSPQTGPRYNPPAMRQPPRQLMTSLVPLFPRTNHPMSSYWNLSL